MKDVKPVLAGAWRLQCSTLFLIPSFIWQIKSATKEDWKKWLKWKNLKYMAGVWLGMYLFSATFFVALAFTSLAHAYLFNNLQSIIIVVGKLVLRQPVMKPEIFGAVLAIFGVSLSLVEVDGGNGESHSTTDIVIGDIIALVGSFGAVIYLLWAKKLRRQIPLFIYILPINILNATSTLILSVIMESTRASESTSLSSHAFGWFSSEYILGTLYLGIVTGVFGMVCYAALLNLLSPLVISVVMLLEPALGTVLGIAVGVSHVPDTWTIVGGVLTLIGTLVVTGVNGAKALKNASKPKKSVSKKSVKEVVVVGVEDKSYPA